MSSEADHRYLCSLCLAGAEVTDWGRRLQILLKLLADFVFTVNMLHADPWIHYILEGFTSIIFRFDSVSPTTASDLASSEHREPWFYKLN